MILRDVNKSDDNNNLPENNDDVIIIDGPEEESTMPIVNDGIDVSNNSEESNYQSNQPFFKNKWVRYGFVALIIVVLIVIFVLIISACNASKLKGFKMTKIPVLYVDETFDFKIVPTEDTDKSVKYNFKTDDENVAYVKYPTLKGKSVKNTIVPTMTGETNLKVEAGKANSTSKIVVCNRLSADLADTEIGVKLNKTTDLDLGVGESNECYENLEIKSDDESIVEIDGVAVKGKKAGSTTVTVSDGKEEVKIKVKVSTKNIYVTSLIADDNLSLKVGEAKKVEVTVKPSDATNKELKWSSSDTSIADVDNNGVVTAKKVGKTTIKAQADDGSGKQVSIKVSVTKSDTSSSTSNSSSGNSSSGTSRTTYYQYRTKTVTPVTTQMCNYKNASEKTEYFYTVNTSFDFSSKVLTNSVGIRLASPNPDSIQVSINAGKKYYDYSVYCDQRVNGKKVYWPGNPSNNPSTCDPEAAPRFSMSSSVLTVKYNEQDGYIKRRYSTYTNYELKYTVYFSANSGNIPVKITAKYYDVSTTVSTARCSDLNSTQARYITGRYNSTQNVVTYSDYKWTSNPNLPNAEYTGQTKVE